MDLVSVKIVKEDNKSSKFDMLLGKDAIRELRKSGTTLFSKTNATICAAIMIDTTPPPDEKWSKDV